MRSDKILDEPTAAARLGVSPRTLRRQAENGAGPERLKISTRRIGYRESDVLDWIASRTSASTEAPRDARNHPPHAA